MFWLWFASLSARGFSAPPVKGATCSRNQQIFFYHKSVFISSKINHKHSIAQSWCSELHRLYWNNVGFCIAVNVNIDHWRMQFCVQVVQVSNFWGVEVLSVLWPSICPKILLAHVQQNIYNKYIEMFSIGCQDFWNTSVSSAMYVFLLVFHASQHSTFSFSLI